MRAVRSRQVRGHRSEPALVRIAFVCSHALATVQDFHRRLRDPKLQHLAHQGLRYAVAVALKLDVAVDVHLDGLEDSEFPRLCGQRLQCRSINLGKGTGTAAR